MPRKKLIWKLFPSHLFITVSALAIFTLFVSNSMQSFFLAETVADLEARATLIEDKVQSLLAGNKLNELNDFCRRVDEKTLTRITVILNSGLVVADSQKDSEKMKNHSSREEVIAALAGQVGSSIRFSQTLEQKMMYVSKPLYFQSPPSNDKPIVHGVLRVSIPITTFDQALIDVHAKVVWGSLVIALISAIINLTVSRRISRPLEAIKRSAEHFGRGDFSRKLTISEDAASVSLEIGSLVDTMNIMAEQLDDRITTAERQHQQLEAVFLSMVEAVIAIDSSENVISINQAAAELFKVDPSKISGENIEDVVGRGEIFDFVKKTMAGYKTIEDDLVFRDKKYKARYLQAHGTRLKSIGGKHYGALIVLNDITRLQKLEEVRQDFVANVSHELKTPITSIKGFVETLLDGAIESPDDTRRFLTIINKQADRLNSIVEDLLTLSSLEQDVKEKTELKFHKERVSKVLQSAVDACRVEAKDKKINIMINCSNDIHIFANVRLIEQAIINLIVNSIKYSIEGSKVLVNAYEEGKEVVILVRDFGVGIGKEHLPRLFERFYRSDKARSRKLGGTGLGLAIVKHIVQSHEGNISVVSSPGEGSSFTIRLPKA